MADEQNPPSVDEIKDRLKIEIDEIEDVIDDSASAETEAEAGTNLADELGKLGRQMGDTLRNAWSSEERQKFEGDVKKGMKSFADEIDNVIQSIRGGNIGTKIKVEATDFREKVESKEIPNKARSGFAEGLRWLSNELGHLADKFTPSAQPTEKSPEDVEG